MTRPFRPREIYAAQPAIARIHEELALIAEYEQGPEDGRAAYLGALWACRLGNGIGFDDAGRGDEVKDKSPVEMCWTVTHGSVRSRPKKIVLAEIARPAIHPSLEKYKPQIFASEIAAVSTVTDEKRREWQDCRKAAIKAEDTLHRWEKRLKALWDTPQC